MTRRPKMTKPPADHLLHLFDGDEHMPNLVEDKFHEKTRGAVSEAQLCMAIGQITTLYSEARSSKFDYDSWLQEVAEEAEREWAHIPPL